MPTQVIKGYAQINTGTVQRDNLDILTPNKSLIRKILISGTNITMQYTGADSGTGDVTLGLLLPINDLSDVVITSPQLRDVLIYDDDSSNWINIRHQTLLFGIQSTPVPIGPAAIGTGTYPAHSDHAHNILNGESVLGGTISLTGTAGSYQDTLLSVTLPSAGLYRITANVRGALTGNAGTLWWLTAKLYNNTDSSDVANSERLIVLTGVTGQVFQMTTAIVSEGYSVSASKVIRLHVFRNGTGGPSWTTSQILSDANGRTTLSYEKIG